ncbi:MAG: MBL fold metallo-hydrolase [Candidatus Eremiobacteraeota bacterium]|nr:MBL fold metallo-hydrolase [Candidatus Eremiobacteraeota bacterium]
MFLERFYDENLAQASYLVGCQATGEAIVIDAGRNIQPYLDAAAAHGLKIVAAADTHIHADYVSGMRELALQTGAIMFVSNEGGPDWTYQFARPQDVLVKDGHKIEIGNLVLEVMHTPGHTPEHISFLLTDRPASSQPRGLFTGDFLFVGDVGRPDLLEKAAGITGTMEAGARQLYHSLQRVASLPDFIQIWPAHGAGSACGKALGAVPQSTLGFEKISNWAFACESEAEFVAKVLDGQPEPPFYFAEMKRINKVGPPLQAPLAPELDLESLQKVVSEQPWVVDGRGAEAFARAHLPGSVYLPPNPGFVNWAGWVLPYDQDFYLVARDTEQALGYQRALRSIGLDRLVGFFLAPTLARWSEQTGMARTSHRVRVEDLRGDEAMVDVRATSEWNAGHIEGALHIHAGYLSRRLAELPEEPLLYCASGNRSLIASSLLERHGRSARDLIGGYAAWNKRPAMA